MLSSGFALVPLLAAPMIHSGMQAIFHALYKHANVIRTRSILIFCMGPVQT